MPAIRRPRGNSERLDQRDADILAGGVWVKQASDRLNCSRALVYALCGQGMLKHIRLGLGRGTIRIEEDDLLAFIELNKTASSTPPATLPLSSIKYSGRVPS